MVAYENIQKENLKNNKQNLLAIKGIRYGRTFFENFISFGMSTEWGTSVSVRTPND